MLVALTDIPYAFVISVTSREHRTVLLCMIATKFKGTLCFLDGHISVIHILQSILLHRVHVEKINNSNAVAVLRFS